ncbi:cysteine desulfurase family protein [Egibacter rhizosphaerae]|uniref:cysteine desulfurase family protein n=1 Tax=Egibacter rhizosphaerae TaxID=1670831 RepID=UPI0013F17B52|nr:cysteine desulfurase family protein [Egibacter rhizosphaerae]
MIYLDHAATTPLSSEALDAMRPHLVEGPAGHAANASSTHGVGRQARAAVEAARDRVAGALGVPALDVLFTSGGTEADNQAVLGIARAARHAGRGAHLVTTAIEHHAVLDPARWLAQREGFDLDVVAPEPDGVVDPDRLLAHVRGDTVLVSVMAANNELGTIQPLETLGPALAERGVPLHTDAVQAFGRMPLDVEGWGLAALSLSAHKFGGPQGVGVLVLRRDVPADPVLLGGGQERGVRSGTLNVAGIVGCGAATAAAGKRMDDEVPRLASLGRRLREGLTSLDGVTLNGCPDRRLPHNANVAVEGCDGEALLFALDQAGVAVSAGSACQSGAAAASHVLEAIGARADAAHVRLTAGATTTSDDVEAALTRTRDAIERLRGGGGGYV